jgi:AI-2 transport protein TqsA
MTQTPLPSSTAEAPSLADTARWMVVIACAFFLLRELGPILKPLFLAVLVGYVVLPIHLLVKRYVPGRLSLVASAILSLILILLLTIGIQATIRTLADQLPTLNAKGVQMRDDFLAWADDRFPQTINSVQQMTGTDDTSARELPGRLVNVAADTVSTAAVVTLYLFFLLLEVGRFPDRVRRAFSEKRADRIMHTIDGVNRGIADYITAKFKASLILATPVWIVLFGFRTPLSLVWAVLTFFCNFVPYLGSVIGYSVPTLFALVTFGFGWEWVAIAVLLLAIHILSASIVEPSIIGRAVGVSPLVILLALAFWGYCWGLTGMLLAVPLTVMAKIVGEHLDATRPLAKLISDE